METTNQAVEGFKLTSEWASQSKKLQAKHTQLTDADLKCESGKENEMLTRVGSRLNKNREEVITLIKKMESDKH